jgi:hypothetical protein
VSSLFSRKRDDNVHLVWHDFEKRFFTPDGKWKYIGYTLMCKIKNWAKKFPTEVQIVSCDDSLFAGSILCLIEHRARTNYMGTSVIYVPQYTGEVATRFFLYLEHRVELIDALGKLGGVRGRL